MTTEEKLNQNEIWKPIKGYEELYVVSSLGRVKAVKHIVTRSNGRRYTAVEKFLTPQVEAKGYLVVSPYRDKTQTKKKVHRLVAEVFIPNPENKPFVNHIDGNKRNNNIKNLEWCTNVENILHAKENGLTAFGEKSGCSKLTNQQVLEIRSNYKLSGYGYVKRIADKYGVSPDTIRAVLKRETWRHI